MLDGICTWLLAVGSNSRGWTKNQSGIGRCTQGALKKETRVRKRTVMNNHRKVAPHGSFATMPARALTGDIQVQLALKDVINDWLTQVIHHVAVAMLKGQSMRGRERKKKEEKALSYFKARQVYSPGYPSSGSS